VVAPGLQALRGIAQVSAVTIAAELGNISGKDCGHNQRFLRTYSQLDAEIAFDERFGLFLAPGEDGRRDCPCARLNPAWTFPVAKSAGVHVIPDLRHCQIADD
jgi:hypothetical protein